MCSLNECNPRVQQWKPARLLDAGPEIATSSPTFWYLSSAAASSEHHASSADYVWMQDLNCFQFSRQYAWLTLRRKPEAEQTSFHPSCGRNITQFVSQMLGESRMCFQMLTSWSILYHFILVQSFSSMRMGKISASLPCLGMTWGPLRERCGQGQLFNLCLQNSKLPTWRTRSTCLCHEAVWKQRQ